MDNDNNSNVSLVTLAKGAARERFDDELERVIANVLDPNTDLSTRSVTLKVTLKPDDTRESCEVKITCASKMGSASAVGTRLYVGKTRDGISAMEFDPKQTALFNEQDAQTKAPTLHQIARAQ